MVSPGQKIGAKKKRSLDILFARQQQTLAWSHKINEAMCERHVARKDELRMNKILPSVLKTSQNVEKNNRPLNSNL